jgi:Common central domain of tyrosinase
MTLGDGIRRNVAKISPEERKRLSEAFIKLDTTKFYPDGVSYWDKQEDIHKNAHAGGSDVHGGPAFIPWHREICNRLEALLREVDPELSLHYWDWTTDPRGNGADLANLFTADFMGGTGDPAGPPFQDFESTEPSHSKIWRDVSSGSPGVESDSTLLGYEDFQAFRMAVENSHDTAHGYIGGSIGNQHFSFHDPFVFLLHSNVDRLWAMWQTATGKSWRLNPNLTELES